RERRAEPLDKKNAKFRYQLTGGHGLPIEGKWYTGTFRNALILRMEGSSPERELQDLRQISLWEGGAEVSKDAKSLLRYAGVAIQYFASVIVVDDQQDAQDFLRQARPTLETAVVKGAIKSIAEDRSSFVLATDRPDPQTFYTADAPDVIVQLQGHKPGDRVAVTYHSDPNGLPIATEIGDFERTQPLWIDDITVRVSTEP